jgi:hypothetical protein
LTGFDITADDGIIGTPVLVRPIVFVRPERRETSAQSQAEKQETKLDTAKRHREAPWLLSWTRSLAACVISHGVANLALGIYVIVAQDWKFW